MTTVSPRIPVLRPAAWAGTLTLLAVMTCAPVPAFAQTQNSTPAEDQENIDNHILNTDKRIFNSVLGALGLAPSDGETITYRERSPLVVPPQRDLPPPERSLVQRTPDWPVDPEVKRRKEEQAALKNVSTVDPSKPIAGTPAMGARGAAGTRGPAAGGNEDPAATLKKPDSFFNIFSKSRTWGIQTEEASTFTGEPPRAALTEPPPGYLTPSPDAPYGTTKRQWELPKLEKPL